MKFRHYKSFNKEDKFYGITLWTYNSNMGSQYRVTIDLYFRNHTFVIFWGTR